VSIQGNQDGAELDAVSGDPDIVDGQRCSFALEIVLDQAEYLYKP